MPMLGMGRVVRSRPGICEGIITLALVGLLGGMLMTPAHVAAEGVSSIFTLDGEALVVTSSFMPSPTFTVAQPGAADQTAVSSSADPYQDLTIEAVSFGRTSPGEGLPKATSGEAPTYRNSLNAQRHAQGGAPITAPDIDLFGTTVQGSLSQVSLHVTTTGTSSVAMVEWVAQADSRLWIVRADAELTAGTTPTSFADGLIGTTIEAATAASPSASTSPSAEATPSVTAEPSTSATPASGGHSSPVPSVSPATASSTRHGVTAATLEAATVAQAGTNAPWWNGTCDVGNNGDGYPLGAVYGGVVACGPRPWTESPESADDYLVHFYSGAWGEYEFECVELVMRYAYLTYGVAPYSANGNQVVTNYSGSKLVKVTNGTAGVAPEAGDLISFGADTADGHTAVVTGASVDASGNGSVTVMEENNSAGGSATLTVSDWTVGPDAYPTIGWLHSLGSDGPAEAVSQSTGQQYLGWKADDGGLSVGDGNHAEWSDAQPLSGAAAGGVPAVTMDTSESRDAFWRASNGDLWEATATSGGAWASAQDIGPGWNLGSDPAAAVNTETGARYVIWQGQDGGLWEGTWNGTQWSLQYVSEGTLGSAPTVVEEPNGTLAAFWEGTNGDLWGATFSGGAWSGPGDDGPGWNLGSKPAAAADTTNGHEYVFWRGLDQNIWEGVWNGSSWTGPQLVGMGPLGSVPTASVEADESVDVYWEGTNADIWGASYASGTWSGPVDEGAGSGWDVAGAPGVTADDTSSAQYLVWPVSGGYETSSWAPSTWTGPTALAMGTLGSQPTAGIHGTEEDLFWEGANGDLWEAFSSGGTWYGPYDQGPSWNLGSRPAVAVTQSSGSQAIYWRGNDGNLWEGYWSGSGWVGPDYIPMGQLGSAPTAGAGASGEQDVFWRGTNGDLWEGFQSGGTWYGPYDQGPGWGVDSNPAVAVDQSSGNQYVFWQNASGGLSYGYWNGHGWWGPYALPMGVLGSTPTAGVQADGEVDVYWRGGNGYLWEATGGPGGWHGPFEVSAAWNG